jgi:hypothetical protein
MSSSPVEILENCIREKEAELLSLRQALKILQPVKISTSEGPSDPAPSPLKAVAAEQTAAPAPSIPAKPAYTGPRCGACGAKMYQTYRTMPSGAVVNLLKCNDSACGNEAYQ